jgi:hypothetical protein
MKTPPWPQPPQVTKPRPGPRLPKRLFIERVMLPRRLYAEPESGLDSFIGAVTPMVFQAAGLPIIGELVHGLQTTAEVHDGLKPETMPQAEQQARQAFVQNGGQVPLGVANPIVLVPSERTVERTIDPLDPEMMALDPVTARRYQRGQLPTSLGDACAVSADASRQPVLASDSKEAKMAEVVPWRRRR